MRSKKEKIKKSDLEGSWSSNYFDMFLQKGKSIDDFLNDKRLVRLLTKETKKTEFNLAKEPLLITVHFKIKKG